MLTLQSLLDRFIVVDWSVADQLNILSPLSAKHGLEHIFELRGMCVYLMDVKCDKHEFGATSCVTKCVLRMMF